MKVCLGSILQGYAFGKSEVTASGSTIAQVLNSLDEQYPGLRFRVVDEQDRIRPHIHVHCNDEMVRDLSRKVKDSDTLHILGALSGG
ncbi:MAG: MoaD/ThiS family protein [Planctomycetota bacterium]